MILSKREPAQTDSGFTLVELLLSMSILGVIITAISASMVVFLNTGAEASRRDDHSGGSANTAAYLDRDLASADTAAFSGTACSGSSNSLVLSWTQWSATAAAPSPAPTGGTWTAAYRTSSYTETAIAGSPTRYQLERYYCRPGQPAQKTVLVRNLLAAGDFSASTSGSCTAGTRTAVVLKSYNADPQPSYTWTGCVAGRRS